LVRAPEVKHLNIIWVADKHNLYQCREPNHNAYAYQALAENGLLKAFIQGGRNVNLSDKILSEFRILDWMSAWVAILANKDAAFRSVKIPDNDSFPCKRARCPQTCVSFGDSIRLFFRNLNP
jgi:hypothetical protein